MIEEFIEIPNEGLVFRIVVGPVETLLGWHGVESGEVLPHVVHLVGSPIVVFIEVEVQGDLVLGAGLEVLKETLKLRRVLQIIVQSEQMWFVHFSFILDLELDDASAESGDDDLGRVLLANYLDVVERVDGVALIDLVPVLGRGRRARSPRCSTDRR